MLKGELNTRGNLRGALTGGVFYGTNDYEDLINKPSVNGVVLDGNKTTEDLGIIIPDKVSDLTNDLNYVEASDLQTVAFTGSYNDLTDTPSIPAAQVNSDWNAVSGVAEILNKPTIPTKTSDLVNDSGYALITDVPTKTSDLVNDSGYLTSSDVAEVAITGNYDDLINKPTIPAAQVQSDWDQADNTQVDYIKNKPTIPTNLSDLNNDEGFIGFTDLTGTLTAGSTSLTLSDASITASSFIQVFASNGNVNYTSITSTTGSVILTFLAQASDMTVTVRIS